MMPQIVEIDGHRFEFPDDATMQEIDDATKPPSVTSDVLKTIAGAPVRVASGLAGLPGDIGHGMRWLASKAGIAPDNPDYIAGTGKYAMGADALTPESPQILSAFERNVTPVHRPETAAGKYAGTVSDFALGAALSPGRTVGSVIRQGVVPGVASETAGQATEGTAAEPFARAAGGMFGLGAAELATRRPAADRIMSRAMVPVTDQHITDAATLMQQALARGVNLTWPEAIQQVTNSGTTLGNLQRVAEASQGGGNVMRPFMAERAGQVENAMDQFIGDVRGGGVPMTPHAIGPRASEAAAAEIENIRRAINRATEPLYTAAGGDTVSARVMSRLQRVPGFNETLAAVRANPHLNRHIQNLPDNSVSVLNEVRKQLSQQGENMGNIQNPYRNVQEAVSAQQSAASVDATARRASRSYRRAQDIQAQRRGTELQPEQEGILGNVATANTTEQAQRALLPPQPLPNTAAATGRATRRLAGQDLRTTQNLVASRLEAGYQKAARDLQSGMNEFSGASARKELAGDRQLRSNIRASLRELPNGQQLSDGFDELMNVFQATGRRQHIGSQTEFNRLISRELESGPIAGEAIAGGFNPLSFMRRRYEQWQVGRNSADLARMMTNPDSRDRLLELARSGRGSPQGRLAAARIVAQLYANAAQSTQSPQNSGLFGLGAQ